MTDIHQYRILILDFGSQYAQLIARRVRSFGVYCELMHPAISDEKIKAFNPSGIILSGGPETVIENNTLRAPNIIFELGVPVLGICYGMQTMAAQLGGIVESSAKREFGFAECEMDLQNSLFTSIKNDAKEDAQQTQSVTGAARVSKRVQVWMSHGDHVTQIPDGFKIIAKTNNAPIAAIYHSEKKFYAVQFHPEVTHTKCGKQILENFVKNICQCESNWTTKNIIAENIELIRKQVGTEKVLLALSGGVDSSVFAH